MERCSRCGHELTPCNTLHGGASKVKWCDPCHQAYWNGKREVNPKPKEEVLAVLNRQRVSQGYGNQFYNEQAKCLAQWTGKEPPVGLVLGALPYVGRFKQDRREEENNGEYISIH